MARRSARRRERLQEQGPEQVVQGPWRRIANPYPPVEILSRTQLETIHDKALGVLERLGLKILSDEALDIMTDAGCDVNRDDGMVRFPRGLVEGLIAKAPSSLKLHARNPKHDLHLGGSSINFTLVSGPPNVSDQEGGRRSGSLKDQRNLIRMAQALNSVALCAGPPVEAMELPANSRHLDVSYNYATLTDKCWGARPIGAQRVFDAVEINRLSRGISREEMFEKPGIVANINVNSPRLVDKEMIAGLMALVQTGQPVVVTPFTLAGAMSPVTIAGALVQQHAEAMSMLAFAQMVRPGAAMIYGGFTSNVDMKSGAPVFGSPEYVRGVLASGQLARHLGLPYRSSNVNASNAVDAQATYESMMSIWAVVMSHANLVWHGHGWLEGGLTASFEKTVLDSEMVHMMAEWLEPMHLTDDELGLAAIEDVAPGGHYFGTPHTLERYNSAFYAPLLSDWRNFENWEEAGSRTTTQRANETYHQLLDTFEEPPTLPERREAMEAYIAKRKEEIRRDGIGTD